MKRNTSDNPAGPTPRKDGGRRFSAAVPILILLTLAMFGDVLFTGKDIVLSQLGADLSSQFIPWREFGFSELKNGNLALWNPHIFSGTPYLGGFQSALLYPPNLLHLVMSVGTAINVLIALHIFLGGLFMYLWASQRKLHPLACLTSAGILMFCGTQFLHIYAGHLPNLYTMAWAPLLFLAIDGFFRDRSLGWCLVGTFSVTMQILAGHPQYVFYTAVAAALYSCLCLVWTQRRLLLAGGLVAMFAGAAALTSVQLLTGLDAAGQSVRSVGVPLEFASMFSFPPENFITFLVPGFFGDMIFFPYWGRCYLWEMSVFMGTTGFFLAVYGVVFGASELRRFSLSMTLILLLLALGSHTPLFKVLYEWVPGFDTFRGNSKFTFQASLFLAMLAGVGLHQLMTSRKRVLTTAAGIAAVSLLACIAGFAFQKTAAANPPADWWRNIMARFPATEKTIIQPMIYADPDFIREAGAFAANGLWVASGSLLLLALILMGTRFFMRAAYLAAFLALAEVFTFARLSRTTFDLSELKHAELSRFLEVNRGDYRTLNPANPNSAMLMGTHDLWGYDPGVSLRYACFMAFTQGLDPDQADQYLGFHKVHPLFAILRCRYAFAIQGDRLEMFENKKILPQLQLIQDYRVMTDRDEIFAAMTQDFDPAQTVILESEPLPRPVKAKTKGIARIVDASTDHMTIEAFVATPSLLLITDAYDTGWRARALPGSDQDRYTVLPSNYVLRTVPLTEGFHRLCLEYRPFGFEMGKWISLASLAVYAGLVGLWLRKQPRHNHDLHS